MAGEDLSEHDPAREGVPGRECNEPSVARRVAARGHGRDLADMQGGV